MKSPGKLLNPLWNLCTCVSIRAGVLVCVCVCLYVRVCVSISVCVLGGWPVTTFVLGMQIFVCVSFSFVVGGLSENWQFYVDVICLWPLSVLPSTSKVDNDKLIHSIITYLWTEIN